MRFYIANEDEIKSGKTTDIYFIRTEEILRKKNINKHVIAEFTVQSLPRDYDFAVFSGLYEALNLLEGLDINVYALPEGTIFKNISHNGVPVPVMYIEGNYIEFAKYETPALGLLCQASGIATKSARIKREAGEYVVLSFGIRRMHPVLAPFIDRNAYIGGCDGVSSIKGAEVLNLEPKGTMPHALMLVMGEKEAWLSYDEVLSEKIPRIALIDTFCDEKTTALKATETFKKLDAVRLDTPGSRRGNFAKIVKELRWELDIRGFKNVGIIVSGGLDEKSVKELKDAGATGFGVGTSISNAPTIDYAMDIVEIEKKPIAKRGKFSGRKEVYRCKHCGEYFVLPYGEKMEKCPVCGKDTEKMLHKVMENGKKLDYFEDRTDEIREYVLKQLKIYQKRED